MRGLALLLLALALAGCGEGGRGHGTATLWVTHDRGTHVVFSGSVPAGLNGVQTVERRLDVTTRYGGRYVQSIEGAAGSLSHQRDWFFFVNGVEGDRSAAEVRVRPGDVLWWDFRRWTGSTMDVPVVVGAYPHPFVDGQTSVVGDPKLTRPIAAQVHGVVNARRQLRNFIVVGGRLPPATVRIKAFRGGYLLELGANAARRLARDPLALRYRF